MNLNAKVNNNDVAHRSRNDGSNQKDQLKIQINQEKSLKDLLRVQNETPVAVRFKF
ncbi:hypothetical protein D3C86_1911840 [compost metagenome]